MTERAGKGLSQLVRGEIDRRFPGRHAEVVAGALEGAEYPLVGASRLRDRIHLAVLLESRGTLAGFEVALARALADWRDALVAAGLQHEDWPEVLRSKGIAVP